MPGTSSRADVLRVTQALPFIDASSLTEGPVYYYFDSNHVSQRATGSQLSLPCKQSQRTCLSLILVDDVLVEMVFLPDQAITMGQLAAHLGDPDYIRFIPSPGFGPSCDVGLIWLDKAVVAWLHNNPGSTVGPNCADLRLKLRVDDRLEVNQILYLLPQDQMLAGVPEETQDYAWVGFLAEP